MRKIATFDYVYTPASTNINQSAPNLVKIYMIVRSLISLIMYIIQPEQFELSAFEFGKITVFDVVYTLAITSILINKSENISFYCINSRIFYPIMFALTSKKRKYRACECSI